MADEPPGAQGSSQFVYQPLTDPSRSLRLIYILPGTSIDQISLRMVNVDDPVEYSQVQDRSKNSGWASRNQSRQNDRRLRPGCYRCLSYMWGDATGEELEILVNGRPFRILKNLYRFLDCARGKFYQNALWIDALCMDQDNMLEKSHQVQRMGHIFKNAQEVLLWLGDGPELYSIHAAMQRGTKIALVDIAAVVQNPYWKRAWIVQEFLLARNLRVVGSFGDCDWNDFRIHPTGTEALTTTQLWVDRHDMRICGYDHLPTGMLSFLVSFPTRLCSDKRDRIYSLLGLSWSDQPLNVDYTEDVGSLFWRVGEQYRAWNNMWYLSGLQEALEVTESMVQSSLASGVQEFTVTISVEHIDWTSYGDCAICEAYDAATEHFSRPKPSLEQLGRCGFVAHLNDLEPKLAPGHIHLIPNSERMGRGSHSMDIIFALGSEVQSAEVRSFLLDSNAFEYSAAASSWVPLHRLSDLLAILKPNYLHGDPDLLPIKPCLWNWEYPAGVSFRVRLHPQIILAVIGGSQFKC